MTQPLYCIVGAGLAGGRAAEALREFGFEGRVVLLGAEADPPYERPPLSKAYLKGELPRAKLYLRAPDFYREREIEWRPGTTVTELDLGRHRLRLDQGEELGFDKLLLATGSRPRLAKVEGADLLGVRAYRTVADADWLHTQLGASPRVLVLGGGFLGTELAGLARRAGCQVTVVEAGDRLVAPLGKTVSGYCADLHRQAGVELLLEESVARFLGGSRLEAARLGGGRTIPCDLALVCIGAEPGSELAAAAGLEVDPGVVVDQRLRTRDKAVWAAGDVASWWSERWGRRLRVEHYDNAHQQGRFVATAMLGESAAYDPLPYFWTEQLEQMIQQVGLISEGDEAVLRGDPESGKFAVFYLRQGSLSGCLAVNRFPDLAAARRLIAARVPVASELLGDPSLDLSAWARRAVESARQAPA